MVIIKVELLQEKKEIHNEMSLLLERVTPSSKVFIEKGRSRFGLLSSTYLIAQRFFLLKLQVNYLRRPYDIQEK